MCSNLLKNNKRFEQKEKQSGSTTGKMADSKKCHELLLGVRYPFQFIDGTMVSSSAYVRQLLSNDEL